MAVVCYSVTALDVIDDSTRVSIRRHACANRKIIRNRLGGKAADRENSDR